MSQIDITKPAEGAATTQSVRDNFATAKNEIEALEAAFTLPLTFDDQASFMLYATNFSYKTFLPNPPKYVSLGTTAMTANRRQAVPFFVPRDTQLANVRARVTALHASNFQIGIYTAAEANPLKPGDQQWTSGELSANSNAVITAPCDLLLLKNTLYYLVNHFQGTPTLRNLAASDLLPFFPIVTTDVNSNNPILSESIAYATLPLNLSASALAPTAQSVPAISLERV